VNRTVAFLVLRVYAIQTEMTVHTDRSGPAIGLIAKLALAYRTVTLRPADRVTLVRATIVGGVAALTADSFVRPVSVAIVVTLAVIALALDAVDGWVARHTRTASPFGARFDMEVDAFLILVLSVDVARSVGSWVLAIGVARYVFGGAGWLLRWLREPMPSSYWGKTVAAIQGIVLTTAAAGVLPTPAIETMLAIALALLAESFAHQVWWLARHRDVQPRTRLETAHRMPAHVG
jgi:phosphatidylglycerophosphate synthase